MSRARSNTRKGKSTTHNPTESSEIIRDSGETLPTQEPPKRKRGRPPKNLKEQASTQRAPDHTKKKSTPAPRPVHPSKRRKPNENAGGPASAPQGSTGPGHIDELEVPTVEMLSAVLQVDGHTEDVIEFSDSEAEDSEDAGDSDTEVIGECNELIN